MSTQDPLKWFRRQSAQTTVILCALLCAGAIVVTFTPLLALNNLVFDGQILPRFWTIVTYPFVEVVSLYLIFKVMWIYWIGSMIERDLGSRRFAYVWLAASVIGILPLVLFQLPAVGMLIPGAILVTIWGTRNPNMTVMVFCILPVAAKWIATVGVLSVFLIYSNGLSQPLIGLAAIVGCVVGWLFAKGMIPSLSYGKSKSKASVRQPTRAERGQDQAYYDDVYRREKEREEKERLRKLFEGSLEDRK